jgi:hypothetical protein
MLVPDGPLVGAEQPAFEQGNHPMHARQQMLAFALATSSAAVVDIALQPQVGIQTVVSHRTAELGSPP